VQEDRVAIRLQPLGRTLHVARGTSLQDALHASGVEFPCGGRGHCGGCRVRLLAGELPATPEQREILGAEAVATGWRLACRLRAQTDLSLDVAQWEAEILAEHAPLRFEPRTGRGIVVDLGTTTLVAQLLDLHTGRVLAVEKATNSQGRHGADVMSRIAFALTGEGRATLARLVREQLAALIEKLVLTPERTAAAPVESVIVVGNTVMHHLLCDLDVGPLSRAPFEPEQGGLQQLEAGRLGWSALPSATRVAVLPSLGGFVGSAVLAGILATGLHESATVVGLVDLGTNGEIAIGNRDRILCTSTAAGPAFEGGCIEMGMQAHGGAIDAVRAEDGRLQCRVIGGGTPRGICGSGLVDAVAVALDLGLVEASGRLSGGASHIQLAGRVRLGQRDVRQLQLAKGAIAAGLRILQQRLGLAPGRLGRLSLAGAFGNYVDVASARRIGLVRETPDRVEAAGNTALLGAKLALFGDGLDGLHFDALRAKIECVSLATDPSFQRIFIDETAFPTCL
jgi:uncharacterized 2Fe-2S/4Fe-4S cluster protein (DUF4445 family)